MISKHFSRKEFACKCGCGFDAVDVELLLILEDVRVYFNKPVTINSGCRCVTHNRNINGSTYSQHILGKAADITVRGVDAAAVQNYLSNIAGGLGYYNSFTHIDVSGTHRRWHGK